MSELVLPTSRRPQTDEVPAMQWGVLGTGWIAERFAEALHRHTHQVVAAVGSRSSQTAQRAAPRLGAQRAHGSYEALVTDPEVDVIYIATPHPMHEEHALLAIEAGKHVLVEKPLALNAASAEHMASAARAAGVFCGEAMWTLYLPKFDVMRQLLDAGELGEVTSVTADMGEWFDTDHRIRDPQLAGGAMLDLGTYPVTLATWVFGDTSPARITALGSVSESGVVGQVSAALEFDGGRLAALAASIETDLPTRAGIGGTTATLDLERYFYRPGSFTLVHRDGRWARYEEPAIDHGGLFHEALEVARCVGEGATESPLRPLDATISTLAVMDRIRACAGDRFVME